MQNYNPFHEVTQVNNLLRYALIIQTMVETESRHLSLSVATPLFTCYVVSISFKS